MLSFRRFFYRPIGRLGAAALSVACLHAFIDPSTYLYAMQAQRMREAQVRAIAAKMNVDPEWLLHPEGRTKFDFQSLFRLVGLSGPAKATSSDGPLDVKESIKRVKAHYALVAADTTLAKIAALSQLSVTSSASKGKKKKEIRAELDSVLRLVDKDFLPQVPDGLPGIAAARDARTRSALNDLRRQVKQLLNAPHALDENNIDATLAQLHALVSGSLKSPNAIPRWTRDPLPVKNTYKDAPKRVIAPGYGADNGSGTGASHALSAVVTSVAAPAHLVAAPNAIAPEVSSLAATLRTPAKVFAWVHDNIAWESYSGVAKGALGALKEGRGNDWDQALLLRDLLAAQGYNAQLEWGKVSLPIARAMNLVGTEDPLQAANLLATAGYDGVALTAQGTPVAIQMTHAWVRAFIPYIPDRGATAGTPDTWVRMDPSFKKYDYQAGIAINGSVPWSEDEYLQTSTVRPPTDFYGDKIWSYIRSNNLNCQNLAQVAKTGHVRAENFPYVPSTLTARIDTPGGLAANPPASQMQTVSLSVSDDTGQVLVTYNANVADLWGKKLTLTFPPATASDEAIIQSYGGLFNTPSYLVQLKPVFSIDDMAVAEGAATGAGASLDMNLQFHQPNVPDDFSHHQVVAGETHTEVFDAGALPDGLVQARIDRLKQLMATGANPDAILSEQLLLVGMRYFQHVDEAFAFSTGVRWQRGIKSVFEGDVRRQVNISYNFIGQPIRLAPAENNIDVTHMVVGIIPINNDLSNRVQAMELTGLQSSYLEGAIWEEMQSQQGISATKAMLLSRIAGQHLYTVDRSNVDSVLATTNLSPDTEAEIRGAVNQGRVAKIPSTEITVNRWHGTGYILRDPSTGAATYPISGGLAGGSTTGSGTKDGADQYGFEDWLDDGPWGELIRYLQAEFSAVGGGSPTPSSTQSDPVNTSNGNLIMPVGDLGIASIAIPVTITRTYNSRSSYNGPFGYGWSSNFDESVTRNADGSVMYREGDGTEHQFTRNADGSYAPPPGRYLTLTALGSGFNMRLKEGAEYAFDANGHLVSQKDLNGNMLTINRDGQGMPVSVIDATGRTAVTFTTSAGKITKVTDLAGRNVIYAYQGDDLVSVTDTSGKTTTYAYDLQHNVTQVTDPAGNKESYDYDTDDRVFHHVDANGAEESFQYDIAARQAVVTDKDGGDRYIQFDDRGRSVTEADPAGNVVQATYDASNNRTAITDSRGNTSTYAYDAEGNMIRSVSPDGGITTATYGPYGRPTTMTDESGLTSNVTYDSHGNLTQISRTVNGVTQTTTNTYDSRGNLLTTTDPNGGVTTLTWGNSSIPASRTDAANRTLTYGTDPLGRIASMKDSAGHETKIVYDGRDRISTVTDPRGTVITLTYDDAGRRTALTTPNGTMHYTYDAEGRQLSVTNAMGITTSRTYDPLGRVLTTTDGRGNVMRYDYDAVGRVSRATAANGDVWTYDYCSAIGSSGCSACKGGSDFSFCLLTDPTGKVVKQEFDTMGRVTKIIDPLGNTSSIQYDAAGRKSAITDVNGNTTHYAYDEMSRLLSVTEANGSVTAYTYDKNGNKLSQKDPNGNVWSFRYDIANRLIEMSDPLLRKTSYAYDAMGNLATKTDGNGKTTTYTYDIHRLLKTTYADGSADTYAYDALGHMTRLSNANVAIGYTYDALNRITSTTNLTYNVTIGYDYDANGNWTKMTTPQSTVSYAYDAKNRLASMTDTLFGRFTFGYDAMDRRTTLQYPNGLTTNYQYDGNSQLLAMVTKDSTNAVLDAWSYQYDPAGLRTAKTSMDGSSDTYKYDNLYRLTAANYAGGTSEKFTYDAAGNRLTRTTESGDTTTYSYDVANQVTRAGSDTFTYDNNGNMTTRTSSRGNTSLTYDLANRVTRVSGPDGTENNLYAPNGMRVDMSGTPIENGQVRVIYNLAAQPVLDWGTDNRAWTYRLYGPGIDEALAEYRRANNRTTYLHHDGLGSVTVVSDANGHALYRSTYGAYGNMNRTSDGGGIPPTRLGYTGREISTGSLMNYRSRYYDNSIGRFTSHDSFSADESNPQSLNRYSYAQNNPISFNDPMGQFCANPTPNGAPMWGIGVNRIAPAIDVMDWTHPGICLYLGPFAVNPYLDFWPPTPYELDGLGLGTLLVPHINIKTYAFAVTGKNQGGYGNKKPLSNIHIGIWASPTWVCFIIDDPVKSNPIAIHYRNCIPMWLVYAVAVIILAVLLYFTILWIIEALVAFGPAILEWIFGTSPGWAPALA